MTEIWTQAAFGNGAAWKCRRHHRFHPAEHAVMRAKQSDATLFIFDYRGPALMGRWLVGSVVRQVMHHAHCAVSIAR